MRQIRQLFILLLVSAATGYFLLLRSPNKPAQTSLTAYCAAGLKRPVEEIAAEFEKETGIRVSLQFGGTGTLLTQLRVANKGDLFLAADAGSLADAKRLEVINESLPVALQHPVIAVAKGNPKNIRSLSDLQRSDVRLALTNPEAASIGKVTKRLLGEQWDFLSRKAVVLKPTVTEVAADTQLGAVDASLVWDSVLPHFTGLEGVKVPELSNHEEPASVAVLRSSAFPAEALSFARYLIASDRGALVFKKHGFLPPEGPGWADPAR